LTYENHREKDDSFKNRDGEVIELKAGLFIHGIIIGKNLVTKWTASKTSELAILQALSDVNWGCLVELTLGIDGLIDSVLVLSDLLDDGEFDSDVQPESSAYTNELYSDQ
ncbi:MAG: hypothetical protein LBE37_14335, partial [Sphingobacterium sp.]|jgi:hypothetical protein|nr:hypothetical protein [Sphingobacterium sp.]